MKKKISAEEVYDSLLYVYPERYAKRYGSLMHQNFKDLYREAKDQEGFRGVVRLWILLIKDLLTSSLSEHKDEIETQGLGKHLQRDLHLTMATLVAALLMAPFCLFVVLGMIFSHLYPPDSNPLYHSFLYHTPLLFALIVVLPVMALLISLGSILAVQGRLFSLSFIRTNILAIGVLVLAVGAITLVFGHDMIPCTLTGIFHQGPLRWPQIYQYCQTHY